MSKDVSITKTGEITRELKFSLPEKDFLAKINSKIENIARTAHLKGFRQGKAPKTYVQKLYGKQVQDEIIVNIAKEKFSEAIEKNKLKIVGTFNLADPDYKEGSPLNLSATLEVYPELTADDYKKLDVSYDFQDCDKKFIDKVTEDYMSSYITFREPKKDEVISEGDQVELESEAFLSEKGKKADAISEKDFAISKQIQIIKGRDEYAEIDEALIGEKTGSKKTVELSLPDKLAAENIKGKKAIIEVEVKSFKKQEKPDLTAEFIKRETGLKTKKEFEEKIKEVAKKQTDEINLHNQKEAFLQSFIDKHPFEVPSYFVNNAIKENMYQSGMLDRNQEWTNNIDFSKIPDINKEPAIKEIKKWVILNYIIEKEKIECSEEEVLSWLEKENIKRTSFGLKEASDEDIKTSLEFLKMSYGYPKNMEAIKREVSIEKAFDMVLSTCQMSKNKLTKETK